MNNLLKKIKENKRKGIVLIIFVLVIFFNGDFAKDEKIKTDKAVASFELERDNLSLIMAKNDDEEIYTNIFNSQSGDFYRIGFQIKSEKNEQIKLTARSFLGESQKLKVITTEKNLAEQYVEFIFKTNHSFQDIVLERIGNSNNGRSPLENGKVFIDKFFISRLSIKNDFESKELKKSIFGETKIDKKIVFTQEEISDNVFANKKKQLEEKIETDIDEIIFVDLNLEKIGSGGEGKYKIELLKKNIEKGKYESVKRIHINPAKLEKKRHQDGFYRFPFPAKLTAGDSNEYYLRISNQGVKTDAKNYLKIRKFRANDDFKDGYARLITMTLAEHQNHTLLTNSKIEDLGDIISYHYENSNYVTDYLDVFEDSGKVYFDWYRKTVMANGEKGAYFTYKIDTLYPLKKVHIVAEQQGEKRDEIKLEYSYDNFNWQKMDYTQEENEPQKFDYFVENEDNNSSEIYIKASYNKSKSDKSTIWGLKKFKVNAYLIKNDD